MSREKQIEEMANILCHIPNNYYYYLNSYNDCKRIAECIYDDGGYRKQEWISVDESLPEKWQKCLCYYPEKDYGSKVVVDYAETDKGGFAEQFQFGNPSHWMPLPEAPKMKGGEKE